MEVSRLPCRKKWTIACYEWYPRDGKRSRKHPATRWHVSLKKTVGPLWTHGAQNREL